MKKTKKWYKKRILSLESELANAKEELRYFKLRLYEVANRVETVEHVDGAKILRFEMKSKPYGSYMRFSDYEEDMISWAKSELTTDITKALIDSRILQFIVKKPGECDQFDPLNSDCTVAVKLYVIPWEQAVVDRNPIVRLVEELDAE